MAGMNFFLVIIHCDDDDDEERVEMDEKNVQKVCELKEEV